MREGRVIYIRVSPKDCMGVVDVLKVLEIKPSGMSFAQATSIAFSSAMESLRQSSIIPTRDGFGYGEMMSVFPPDSKASRGRKLEMSKIVQGRSIRPIIEDAPDKARRRRRFEELTFRLQNDPLNISEVEHKEILELVEEFNPAAQD